jgi:hypothetical protein
MTLDDFVLLCKAYRDLGHAVADQLDDVLVDRIEETNPNALRLLLDWLRKVERHSGNDEDFADDVGGVIRMIEEELS